MLKAFNSLTKDQFDKIENGWKVAYKSNDTKDYGTVFDVSARGVIKIRLKIHGTYSVNRGSSSRWMVDYKIKSPVKIKDMI